MNKKELLAEAKRRYPVGTKYICAKYSEGYRNNTVIYDKITVKNNEVHDTHTYLYYNNKWAEIISQTINNKLNNYLIY